jgi:hypothetical protein
MKSRTIAQQLAGALVLAVTLGLATPPAQGTLLISAGGGASADSAMWGGLGSLWNEVLSRLGVRWGPGPGGTARDARVTDAKAAVASATSAGDDGDPTSPTGTSNSTVNPDGSVTVNP